MPGMGERLREWRLARGLTLRELGEAVAPYLDGQPVGRSSVANYERRNGPTSEFLAALVQAYPDFDVHYLLTGRSSTSAVWEESGDGVYLAPEEATDEVRMLIDRLVRAPFGHPEIFLTRDDLTTAEWITYHMAARAALRIIARSLCNDARRFGPTENR